MANLRISEFEGDGRGSLLPIAQEPVVAAQNVSFTTATQSAAFSARTNYVRLAADTNCHVAFGADPTATANDEPIYANSPEWRRVNPGDKVSVYDGTS